MEKLLKDHILELINTENQANHLKKKSSRLFRETEDLLKNKNEFRSDK